MKLDSWASILCLLTIISCVQDQHVKTVHFSVKTGNEPVESMGIRGSIAPLSWNDTYPLEDTNNDGVFESTIKLYTAQNQLEFKFVRNDSIFELEKKDNRYLPFKFQPENLTYHAEFNKENQN